MAREGIQFRKGTTLVDICALTATENVILIVSIGFEQLADILILIEKDEIRHYTTTDPDAGQPTYLGAADNLKGERLRVSILVKDINESQDETSVGIEIIGSTEVPYLRGLTKSVTDDGELVWYTFDIYFR